MTIIIVLKKRLNKNTIRIQNVQDIIAKFQQ